LTCAKTVARRELVRPVSALVYCSCWPWSMRPYLQGDNRLGRLPKRTIAAVELCEVPRAIRTPRPSERDRLSTARQGKAQRRVIGPTIQRDDRDLSRARVLEGDHFELASPPHASANAPHARPEHSGEMPRDGALLRRTGDRSQRVLRRGLVCHLPGEQERRTSARHRIDDGHRHTVERLGPVVAAGPTLREPDRAPIRRRELRKAPWRSRIPIGRVAVHVAVYRQRMHAPWTVRPAQQRVEVRSIAQHIVTHG